MALLFLGITVQAHAAQEVLGQGTSTEGTYNLIYDSFLDITWFDYTNSKTNWDAQNGWADALTVDFDGNAYDGWRLPGTLDDSCAGPNCTNSEMGYLYYVELDNPVGGPLTNTGNFENLEAAAYWSTEYFLNTDDAWNFHVHTGNQYHNDKNYNRYAMAVHDGNISVSPPVVPEPVSMILFGTGGIIMIARRKIFRRSV